VFVRGNRQIQKNGRLIKFEPRNKEYFPLRSSLISEIDITLTDIEDNILKLQYGQPTLVVLNFKKMKRNEYIIRVDSQEDTDGKASAFTAALPPMLGVNPDQKWKVCMNSMIYNGEFEQLFPITQPKDGAIAFHCHPPDDPLDERRDTTPLPYRRFTSNLDLLKTFTDALSACMYVGPDGTSKWHLFYNIRRHATTRRFTFKVAYPSKLYLPYVWAAMMGSTKAPNEYGQVHYKFDENEVVTFDQPLNYNMWVPTYMMLYTNCIDYSNMGSMFQVPILKAIPLELADSDSYYRFYEPPTEEWHHVTYSQLTSLKFWLTQSDGQPIRFVNEHQRIILSLKFIPE